MIKFLSSIFRKKHPIDRARVKVSFHTDDVDYGTHGYIVVQCRQRGINKPSPTRFVFVGLSQPPLLGERSLAYLYEQARAQGFVPYHIQSYGMVVKTGAVNNLRVLLSDDRRKAEDGSYLRSETYGKEKNNANIV